MTTMRILILATIAALPACSTAAQVAECPSDLSPISAPPPDLPNLTENEFRGNLVIRIEIDPSGVVSNAEVISSSLRPIGNGRQQPRIYEQAAIRAIRSWRFPKEQTGCFRNLTMSFEDAQAGLRTVDNGVRFTS